MSDKKAILSSVSSGKKIISVYGLGNVGGPLAAAWIRAGAKLVGVDISENLLRQIEMGTSHKKEPFISETFTKSLKNYIQETLIFICNYFFFNSRFLYKTETCPFIFKHCLKTCVYAHNP